VLPNSPDTREDFEWVRAEIVAAGGDATVIDAPLFEALYQSFESDQTPSASRPLNRSRK
jgi:hypothetical protein